MSELARVEGDEEVPEAWRTCEPETQAFLMSVKKLGGMQPGETFREWNARLSAEVARRKRLLEGERA